MTADTTKGAPQAQGDLVKLARQCGAAIAEYQYTENIREVAFTPEALEAFAAALQGRGTQEGEPSDERAAFDTYWNEDCASWGPRDVAWFAWQARAALAQASLVSVEIREAM